jgi:hypothetical protein
MAKDKNKERISTDHGVYIEGGKYHCADCDHAMNLEEVCPECHRQVEWNKVMEQLRTTMG